MLCWLGKALVCIIYVVLTLLITIIENETELSFFNMEDYKQFKTHPDVIKW